ncbi:1303_t:CDS:2 [Paraglomus brasilianum]|uniref:1303_t:CDS:1 n=1 Tax=Paraglomus brasilianum TaxID=144538 RepID=A0A9N9GV28_9GLOM|nr:1303_t:CDS:2 [Paraglomus brasilianum]
MLSEPLRTLLGDIAKLYTLADDYNVSIEVGEGRDMEVFKAHSVILRARSPYFKLALSQTWVKTFDQIILFKKPNMTPDVFRVLLKYIYTGQVSFVDSPEPNLLDLILAADELVLVELVEQDPELIFRAPDFLSLEEEFLIALLKRDDLGMDEVSVWEHVVRWGIARNTSLDKSPETWTIEDFDTLRNTLSAAFPHIRFFNISPADFYYKVRPYKKSLPPKLRADIKKHHYVPDVEIESVILPPRIQVNKPDSVIINANHIVLLARWIGGQDDNPFSSDNLFLCRKVPYYFKLLLRGSRDGFDSDVFHALCDFQGATVVIIKTGSGQIIGGYNPVNWKSSGEWIATTESFIFNLNYGSDLLNVKLSRVNDRAGAICDFKGLRATGFGGGDLKIFGHTCNRASYDCDILNETTFTREEYEVFKIARKKHSPSFLQKRMMDVYDGIAED